MYNVTAFAFPLSPTTPQASVASIITPGDPALGRLPTQAVAGAVSYASIRNDEKNNPPYSQARDPAAEPTAPGAAFSVPASARLTDTRIVSFPSLFFAQLLSQGVDEQTQSLMVSYETMLEYGNVKYKPSNAGQPQAASPMLDFLKTLNDDGAAPANQNPPTPPAANANNAPRPTVQQQAAETPATASLAAKPAPAPAQPASKSVQSSFLRSYGAKAYLHAVARLEPPQHKEESVDLIEAAL